MITTEDANYIVTTVTAAGMTEARFEELTGQTFATATDMGIDDAEFVLASLAAAPIVQPKTPPQGWSNASRGRRDVVGDMLGLASPAGPNTCHYCGLNPRTCDCN